MERAPLRERAIIRVEGEDAELVLNGEFAWACGEDKLEARLNEYLEQIQWDYYPDPVRFFVERTAEHFGGEIISIPAPLKNQNDPLTVY